MELISLIILSFAGLGILLYGMSLFSNALEVGIGSKLNYKFIQISHHPLKSCLFSAGLTFVTQKTTLVSSMIMNYTTLGSITLRQSLPMVIGLSVGNAISMILMLFQGFNITIFLTLGCFFGAIVNLFFKTDKSNLIAKALVGFGMLFLGIELIGMYAGEMFQRPAVFNFLTNVNFPIVIMLFALIISFATTSSFLSLTLLATLVGVGGAGPVSIESAVLGILTVPFGTTIADYIYTTSGMGADAKRIALYHILVKIFGFAILAPFYFTPLYGMIFDWLGGNATLTLIFVFMADMVLTMLLLPFGKYAEKLLRVLVRDKNKAGNDFAEFVLPESAIASFGTGYVSLLNSTKKILLICKNLESQVMQKITEQTQMRGIKGQIQGIEKAIKITNNAILRLSMNATQRDLQKTSVLNYILNDARYIVKKIRELAEGGEELTDKPKILTNKQLETLSETQQEIDTLSSSVCDIVDLMINENLVTNNNLKPIFDLNKQISTKCQKNRKEVYAEYRIYGKLPESNLYFLLLQNLDDTATAWNDIAIKFGILSN